MSSTIFSTDISSCSLPPLYVSPVSLLSILSLNMSVTFLYNFSFAHNFLFHSSQASSDLDLAKSIILFFLSLQLASCNPLYIKVSFGFQKTTTIFVHLYLPSPALTPLPRHGQAHPPACQLSFLGASAWSISFSVAVLSMGSNPMAPKSILRHISAVRAKCPTAQRICKGCTHPLT